MFKEFANWLLGTVSVYRWLVFVILFGLVCGVAGFISYLRNRKEEN